MEENHGNQDNWPPGKDSNLAPLKYKANDLTATFSKKKPIKSVQEFLCSVLFIFIAGWAG